MGAKGETRPSFRGRLDRWGVDKAGHDRGYSLERRPYPAGDADERVFLRSDGKLADNVNWLDFTHSLTFAEAGRAAVRSAPELWPAVLLQIACFIGRNGAYVDRDLDVAPFAVADPADFISQATERLFDHGLDQFILSAHRPKTLMAGVVLTKAAPAAAPTIHAALNRFLSARIKRRHVLRTARQMRAFVAQEEPVHP
jgi:hypothetical protein